MKFVDRIEELGGFTAAQETDWIRGEIEESAARWREAVDTGERRVVGVNCYQVDEEPATPVFQVDPEVEAIAVERIQELRATRDATRYDDAIGRLREAADEFASRDVRELGDDRLMEAAIDAARAEASTGEIMGAMKGALGWRPPHVF